MDFVVEVGGDEVGVDEVGEWGVGGWGEGEGFGAVGGPLVGVAGEDCGDGTAELGEDEDVAGRGEFLCEAEVGEEGVEFEGVGEVDEGSEGDAVEALEESWWDEGGIGVEAGDDFGVADGLEGGGWGVVVPPGGMGYGIDFWGDVLPEV